MTGLARHVADIAGQLADAHAAREPVRIVGCGTWLDAGRPVHASRTVGLRSLSGIIEYVPGDLVMTVAAGTTLREIACVTGEHRQWLALDPFGEEDGSVGATIATASSGPLALGAGRARDLVLGVSVLAADGTGVRAGGRVVKNVAGFDLVRLATGAFGTLGAITEVSLRLHALPAVDETYAMRLASTAALAAITDRLGLAALGFMSLEVLNAPAAAACDLPADEMQAPWLLLARVTGNRDRCDAQREMLAALGDARLVDRTVWTRVRALDGDRSAVARVSAAPSVLAGTVAAIERSLMESGLSDSRVCVSPHRGAIRLVVPVSPNGVVDAGSIGAIASLAERLQRMTGESPGSPRMAVVWERLPSSCWQSIPASASDLISQRIRDAFDPHRTLNRGIFGEPTLPAIVQA